MERREFLRLTLGFTAAAGTIAATAVAAQAAPMLPQAGDTPPAGKPNETAAQPEAAKNKSDGAQTPAASSDTDMSSQYWRRRRRRYWRRARRRYWRRRRWGRRIYY
jgi:hypothetical protein